jgi:DNA mismatch endonuclease, patch repair protein
LHRKNFSPRIKRIASARLPPCLRPPASDPKFSSGMIFRVKRAPREQTCSDGSAVRRSAKSHDPLSPAERSERMRLIRRADTKPEMVVRRLVHALGYRYRLHSSSLPGHPDLVFTSRKKVIFVHGCFWHQHMKCRQYRMPKSRLEFWLPKLQGNRRRDAANQRKLDDLGWDALIIWECQLRKRNILTNRVRRFLGRG